MGYSIISLVASKSEELKTAGTREIEKVKAAGSAAYYRDKKFPGGIVKEYPDGSRELVDHDDESIVICQLPER